MVYNITRVNKEYERVSKQTLGKPYSIIERLKKGGVGSGKMVIDTKSKGLYSNREQVMDTDFGNIELCPQGIIVHFTERMERFAWIVPYYKLHIYNSEHFSIHGDGNFIKFRKDKLYKSCKDFLTKMMDNRAAYLDPF